MGKTVEIIEKVVEKKANNKLKTLYKTVSTVEGKKFMAWQNKLKESYDLIKEGAVIEVESKSQEGYPDVILSVNEPQDSDRKPEVAKEGKPLNPQFKGMVFKSCVDVVRHKIEKGTYILPADDKEAFWNRVCDELEVALEVLEKRNYQQW